MFSGSTLFLDVCVQQDLWPGGPAALIGRDEAAGVARLLALAGELGIRQGGVVCRHDAGAVTGGIGAPHCRGGSAGAGRPPGAALEGASCVIDPAGAPASLARTLAVYLPTGCAAAPDAGPAARVFDHFASGIRDVVVFGAGVEYGIDRVVAACLRRRIRTHVPLDAVGTADPAGAQRVIAGWKRRTVDGTTVGSVERALRRDRDRG